MYIIHWGSDEEGKRQDNDAETTYSLYSEHTNRPNHTHATQLYSYCELSLVAMLVLYCLYLVSHQFKFSFVCSCFGQLYAPYGGKNGEDSYMDR